MRKYGEDEYKLHILEDNVPLEELNNKEIYYINLYDTYHNGYNQNAGGGINDNFYIYTEEKIEDAIDLLANSNLSFPQISETTGLSITHLYNLNYGLRRRKENIIYPLRDENYLTRGQKLTLIEVEQIKETLKNTKTPIKEIEKMYNCKSISGINIGKLFKDENEIYPLKKQCKIDNLNELIKDLSDSNVSFKKLGEKYNTNEDIISNINRGITYKLDGIKYPIRNNKK